MYIIARGQWSGRKYFESETWQLEAKILHDFPKRNLVLNPIMNEQVRFCTSDAYLRQRTLVSTDLFAYSTGIDARW